MLQGLHGQTRQESIINDLEFEGGERLLPQALAMAGPLAALKRRARSHGIPSIYVNDNFGRWRSDFATLVRHCLHDGVPGGEVAARLTPAEDDYFVLKPARALGLLGGTIGADLTPSDALDLEQLALGVEPPGRFRR